MYNDSETQPPAIASNRNHTSFCEFCEYLIHATINLVVLFKFLILPIFKLMIAQ